MVDPVILLQDVFATVLTLATPALVWLFLYLFAWENPALARATGFGRMTFWLLLPGALVGSLADAPFFSWDGNVLAMNVGGAVIPLLLSLLFVQRLLARPGGSDAARFLLLFAAECAVLFAWVMALPAGLGRGAPSAALSWALLATSVGFPAGTGALAAMAPPGPERGRWRRLAVLLALTSAVLLATFETSQALPGTGIVASFPGYLLGPVGAGIAGVLLARRGFDLPRSAGLPLAYAASTLGVLVGADVLWEPPLYGGGAGALLAIGGAGLLDLVYLTGLLALAVAFLTWRVVRRLAPSAEPALGATPSAHELGARLLLRRARRRIDEGAFGEGVALAAAATGDAIDRTRALVGLPPATPGRSALEGLPVPPWIAADHENLLALAGRAATASEADARRALVTARLLVGQAEATGRARFAGARTRALAVAFDLLVLTAPALALWVLVAWTAPGRDANLLGNLGFLTITVGYAAWAFAYFVVGEVLFATTLGKRRLGLRVTDRDLRPISLEQGVLRNLPKLVGLSVLAVALAAAVEIVRFAGAAPNLPVALFAISLTLALVAIAVLVGLAVPLGVSLVWMTHSPERQRLGDYLAGTWVTRPLPAGAPPPPAPWTSPAPGAGPSA